MTRRTANPCRWATALYSSQPFNEAKATEIVNLVRVALQLMLDGAAEDVHFMRLGVAVNIAAIRAEQIGGGDDAIGLLNAAGAALKECEGLKERHGRYGLTGPGRHHLMAGIDTYEALLRASSPRQMHLAEQELGRRLKAMERAAA